MWKAIAFMDQKESDDVWDSDVCDDENFGATELEREANARRQTFNNVCAMIIESLMQIIFIKCCKPVVHAACCLL